MDIEKQLSIDFKEALLSKNKIMKNTIQLLRADILNHKKELKCDLTENEIFEIVSKEIKQKEKALSEFLKGKRSDLAEQTQNEIAILEKYMPKALSRQELDEIVRKNIINYQPFTKEYMGIVIKKVKEQVGARADGKVVFELVKSYVISK